MELDTPSSDMNSVINGLSDNLSGTTTPRGHSASTPVADNAANSMLRKAQKRKHALGMKGASGLTRPSKRMKSEDFEDNKYDNDSLSRPNEGPGNNGEDADNNLYCFCQRVSFGEMIGVTTTTVNSSGSTGAVSVITHYPRTTKFGTAQTVLQKWRRERRRESSFSPGSGSI